MNWSSEQYLKFEEQRNRPIQDLLARVAVRSVKSAVDLGCGPGNSTEFLKARFPDAHVYGVDSSDDMIAAARKRLPSVDFVIADINSWDPEEKFDLILSNATFQWLPDHEQLFTRLIRLLNPGGAIAVQMPDNLDEPAHVLLKQLASEPEWKRRLDDAIARVARPGAEWYFDKLQHLARLDIWRTTYFHDLPGGVPAIAEWFKGTSLRPYLHLLSESEQEVFVSQYVSLLRGAYREFDNGITLLPFPRLFVVASPRAE